MKDNRTYIVGIIIILIIGGYLINDFFVKEEYRIVERYPKEENISMLSKINLDYLDIYLYSNGDAYLIPITDEKISKLDSGDNLKDRLNTLASKAESFNSPVDDSLLKGFKVVTNSKIESMYEYTKDGNIYIIFLKLDNTIAVFNYENYYNLMYIESKDNYNNISDVLKIEEDIIYFLDGTSMPLEKIL